MFEISKSYDVLCRLGNTIFAYHFSISPCAFGIVVVLQKMTRKKIVCGGLKIPDRLEIIKNQQLINLHRATHFWAWFCLHVSQYKLSAGTPLCDINFISAIKRNVQEVMPMMEFHPVSLCKRRKRKEKMFPPETVKGKKKLLGSSNGFFARW